LIFGKTNYSYFFKHFNLFSSQENLWQAKKSKGKCYFWVSDYRNYKIIGLSTNLGNPKGFDTFGLNELGNYLKNITS